MAEFPEAKARLFTGVFVCIRCKKRVRGDAQDVKKGKVVCPRCQGKLFRSKKEIKKVS